MNHLTLDDTVKAVSAAIRHNSEQDEQITRLADCIRDLQRQVGALQQRVLVLENWKRIQEERR